jgi:hypothetical protein
VEAETTMFDDEITLIDVRPEDLHPEDRRAAYRLSVEPPPLPFPLATKKPSQEAWLSSLDPRARAVLEAARVVAPAWPIARRIPGAVAQPSRRAAAS